MPRSSLRVLWRDGGASAGVEMALVAPMMIFLMFGSAELGNYFLSQHAITEQVRDGARFASRMTLASSYSCTAAGDKVFKDTGFATTIANVTKTGSVDGSATGRFDSTLWDSPCDQDSAAITVTLRCVSKTGYAGLYSGLSGDIPVVKVTANVRYPSLFGTAGFDATNLCLRASSEAAVAGL